MTITPSWRAGRPLAVGAAGSARAADFPSRPMNWIVPFPPGGSNDIFARPIAAFVGQRLQRAGGGREPRRRRRHASAA